MRLYLYLHLYSSFYNVAQVLYGIEWIGLDSIRLDGWIDTQREIISVVVLSAKHRGCCVVLFGMVWYGIVE